MAYDLDYKVSFYEYSRSNLNDSRTRLDIYFYFNEEILKISSREKRKIMKYQIKKRIKIGDDVFSFEKEVFPPNEIEKMFIINGTFLDNYLLQYENFKKKNYHNHIGLYEDLIEKNRKMEIRPFLVQIGLKIFIESNKILKPEEMLDYKNLNNFILTGKIN